jgi:hypothetical protein
MTVAYRSRRDPYGSPPFRSTLNLSLPPDFTAGMYAAGLANRVRPRARLRPSANHDRGASGGHRDRAAPASALDAVLKLIGALTKLEQGEPT